MRGERADPNGELEALIARFVECNERGETISPEAFCESYPAHAEALLPLLRQVHATDSLFPESDALPDRIGAYRVQGEIGRGGMGRVLAVAREDALDRPLALKILHAPFAERGRSLERFRRESRSLARITHPGVVRVLDSGLHDGRPYIVMERVQGTCLADARAGDPASSTAARRERAARLVAQAARAIAAVHAAGVLHRDLNPRNLLVRADGSPVVIDFGLMRSNDEPTLTGTGDVLGTPQYMAPEQARGERMTERTDVFGLGAILFELVGDAPPRAAGGTLTLLRAAASRPLPRLRSVSRDCPRELAAIVHRATAFDPRWRYASATELADDLDRWLAGRPIAARAPGVLERAQEAWHAHRVATSAAIAALLIGAAASLAWTMAPRDDQATPDRDAEVAEIVVAWLDGDPNRASASCAEVRGRDRAHPLGEFLAAICDGDWTREGATPVARAMLSGERARRDGRASDAIVEFATAWDVAPGFPLVTLLQGLAELEADEPALARSKLETVAYHFGRSHRLHRALATTYAKLGEHADVVRALRAALALRPDDVEAWIELARAHRSLGELDGVRTAALEVAKLDADGHRGELEELATFLEQRGAPGADDVRSASRR